MIEDQADWSIHPDLIRFKFLLPHLASRLSNGGPVKIVAFGSSSTAGEGRIVPYPAHLELELRSRFPGRRIDVLNRGVGGEEAPEELARMNSDILDESPDLVVWQMGTNAVWKGYDLERVAASIGMGLERLQSIPTDVILMTPQYVPALVDGANVTRAERMVRQIGNAANSAGVNLFDRYGLMRRWSVEDGVPLETMVDPNDETRLHQSDWSTGALSRALTWAIVDAVTRSDADGAVVRTSPAPTRTARPGTSLLLDDLLPTLFDAAVLGVTGKALLPIERDAILTALVNSVGECVMRRLRNAGTEETAQEISVLETIDRFSDGLVSRVEIIEGIANSSGLDRACSELALFLMEARLDVELGRGEVAIAGIGSMRATHPDRAQADTARLHRRIDEILDKPVAAPGSGLMTLLGWPTDNRERRLLYEAQSIAMFRNPVPCRIILAAGLAFKKEVREAEWVDRKQTKENRFIPRHRESTSDRRRAGTS
jgi:hypothetical protein